MSETTHNFIGYVHPPSSSAGAGSLTSSLKSYDLGGVENLKEISDLYHIDEIIFCARDIPSNSIINYMSSITAKEVEFKIAPPESLFIIGSSSVNNPGELYVIDINSISRRVNQRNKRLLDIMLCLLFLILSPILIFFQRKPANYLKNIFSVLAGYRSWVGYRDQHISTYTLPAIRKGILNPIDILRQPPQDDNTINRLNSLYAKDYHVFTDMEIIRKSLRSLGN
jgi:hypothetical protein